MEYCTAYVDIDRWRATLMVFHWSVLFLGHVSHFTYFGTGIQSQVFDWNMSLIGRCTIWNNLSHSISTTLYHWLCIHLWLKINSHTIYKSFLHKIWRDGASFVGYNKQCANSFSLLSTSLYKFSPSKTDAYIKTWTLTWYAIEAYKQDEGWSPPLPCTCIQQSN